MKKTLTFCLVMGLLGCGDDDVLPLSDAGSLDAGFDSGALPDAGNDAGAFDAGNDAGPPDAGNDAGPVVCVSTGPSCLDEHFTDLGFQEALNTGDVTTTPMESGFVTVVDTRAGGLSPTESYAYLRFTDDGLEKLELNDDDAFESTDWDIALRRFVLRLNSGVSGPGCVEGGRTAGGTDFDALDGAPEGLPFRTEEYFSADCTVVTDGSGIGSPATALASFWTYAGCVQMTGNVYVLRLGSGRTVKLRVDSYYGPDAQQSCNETGSTGGGPSTSGTVTLRWDFLD